MKRLAIVILCLLVVFACSKKEPETTATNTTQSATESHSDEPKQMIPDKPDQPIVFAAIKPFFDDKGTVTEKTISPGDEFEVFIIAEYEETNSMTAAEYKLVLPAGVSILASQITDSLSLQSGKPETDFMIAFKCSPGPKMFLVRYTCLAGQNFAGGVIQTAEGDQTNFIGLVTCGNAPVQHKADTGKAVLKIN